jgi:hypothetical protein
MRLALIGMLALGGCVTAGTAGAEAQKQEILAQERAQLGDGAGAQRAARRAAGLRELARRRQEEWHGWFWNDVTLD